MGRKACKKRDLLSLIGVLSHACKAVRAGRSFLRRLIDLSMVVKNPDNFVRLSQQAKSVIEWWFRFSESWNGVAMMHAVGGAPTSISMTSDASGSWGCGAFVGSKSVVLAAVGRASGRLPHHSQGASANRHCGSSVGWIMVGS